MSIGIPAQRIVTIGIRLRIIIIIPARDVRHGLAFSSQASIFALDYRAADRTVQRVVVDILIWNVGEGDRDERGIEVEDTSG